MAEPRNSSLRILVPALTILIGIGVFAAVLVNTVRQSQQRQPGPAATSPLSPTTPTSTPPTLPTPSDPPQAVGVPIETEAPGQLPPPEPPAAPPVRFTGLKAEPLPRGTGTIDFSSLGSIDPGSSAAARIEFTTIGAGIRAITLSRHFETIERTQHIVVQHEHTHTPQPTTDVPQPREQVVVPCAALGVEINGQWVPLTGTQNDPTHGWVGEPVWRELAPGQFEAHIIDADNRRIARIVRQYELGPDSYVVLLRQWVQNLTSDPITVRWQQFGPIDLDRDMVAYGGDRRRVRFGYLFPPQIQRGDPTVAASDFVWDRTPQPCFFWSRNELMGPTDPATGLYETVRQIWPNQRSVDRGYRLVWTGMTNRYFGAALHPPFERDVHPDSKVFTAAANVDRVLLHRYYERRYDPIIVLRTTSAPVSVAPGAAADVSMALYAGPLSRGLIGSHVSAAAAGLRELVIYNFGGPCAPCTFGFLTAGLLNLLLVLHHYVVFDWALAIIVLVLIVRTLLHPVTRWSQIRLQRFGKQFQDLAPKQKKIQEKFKDDPQRLREETAKLLREEGINPAGALGCVPMFLQMPVWIALFAMLFFAFELRHEPAFFGIFQVISGGRWWFLADLAEPDRFIDFGGVLFSLPLLGPIQSFNVLPILLGVVFFIQQKYLTPPTTATLTPEQQQQQRMIKIMMVVLFPVFMYNAPSGLSLYFIVNSSLAIIESKWIRKHIEKHGLLEVKKRPIKPGGFMARLQQLAEERQRRQTGRGTQGPRKRE